MKSVKLSIFLILIAFAVSGQSVLGTNYRAGCPFFFKKLNAYQDVTIAFLGGSITNHEGYRVYVTNWFKDKFPQSKITSINAGVGGTGSDLGVYRMDDDVLSKKPDLVFIEFAVNDGGGDTVALARNIEGIIRKIRKQNLNTDIVFLYTAQVGMIPDLSKGIYPKVSRIMDKVASYYDLPSLHLGFKLADMIGKGEMDFKPNTDTTKRRPYFSDDGTHPTLSFGHHVYSDNIISMMENLMKITATNNRRALKTPLDVDNTENALTYSVDKVKLTDGWAFLDSTDLIFTHFNTKFNSMLSCVDFSKPITFKFIGKQIGFYDVIGPFSGRLKVKIDDEPLFLLSRFDSYCFYTRANYFFIKPKYEAAQHTVTIMLDDQPFDKLSILKPRHTDAQIGAIDQYNKHAIYIGKILVDGKLIY